MSVFVASMAKSADGCDSSFCVNVVAVRLETCPTDGHMPPRVVGGRPPGLGRSHFGGYRAGCKGLGPTCLGGSGWRLSRLGGPCCLAALFGRAAASLAGLLAKGLPDLRPGFVPAVAAHDIAQGDHRVHVLTPANACHCLSGGFDHQLVAALHRTVANRPTGRQKERVLHL